MEHLDGLATEEFTSLKVNLSTNCFVFAFNVSKIIVTCQPVS